MKEYYYSESDSPDIWNNDDLDKAAFQVWSEHDGIEDENQEGPCKGDTAIVYRGKSDPITHKELSLDLREHLKERLYEIAGEAAELTDTGDDLQSDFEKWLSENVEINTCRIVDIKPIKVTYDGTGWTDLSAAS